MQRPPPRSTRTYTPVPYATLFRSLGRKPVLAQSPLRADRVAKTLAIARCEPMRHQIELREALRAHQRMVISVVVGAGRPAGELRALLERRVGGAEQFGFRDAHPRPRQLGRESCRERVCSYE